MTGGPAEVVAFFADLRAAVARLHRVQPEALREPLSLWFRATLERAERERWTNMLGREVASVWEAAKAINVSEPWVGVRRVGDPTGHTIDECIPPPDRRGDR